LIRRLATARERAGLTQTEAARRLQKEQSYIAKVEGLYRRLDILELWEFLSLYGISGDDFYLPPTEAELRAVRKQPRVQRRRPPR
jgi:transcriptional regulator with XRE-family HTH domain